MDNLIFSHPSLQSSWHWLGERSDIPKLLATTDALIHVSLYEGLPNAICEAFIASTPVIASAVCDHPSWYKEEFVASFATRLCLNQFVRLLSTSLP